MKPERLKDKKVKLHYGYEDTIEFEGFEYKDIKSAVEFYKKYSGAETHHTYPDAILRFREDFEGTEAWNSWIKYKNKYLWTNGIDVCHEKLLFRSWLFDYCFKDVI